MSNYCTVAWSVIVPVLYCMFLFLFSSLNCFFSWKGDSLHNIRNRLIHSLMMFKLSSPSAIYLTVMEH